MLSIAGRSHRSHPAEPMRLQAFSALIATAVVVALGAPLPALAQPAPTELALALRSINRQLDFARARLAEADDVTGTGPVERLTRAEVAAYTDDHPRAAMLLIDLVSRPGFADHPAHPEAMSLLGESLWAIGLHRAAVEALREALASPRQIPSAYRRRLAQYLARAGAGEPLDRVREYWQRAQAIAPPAEPSDAELSLAYHYGRALFRGGALDEAAAVFEGIPVDGPDGLRARYFRGVVALKQGETLVAAEAFEAARAAWAARAAVELEAPAPSGVIEAGEIEAAGPAREVTTRDDAPEAALADALTADDPRRDLRRMGAVIHLALARMAAAEGDDARAWQLYREVSRGDPDHAQALAEGTFVLFRLGEYAWCVRLIDQLLAGRGDDLSAAQLALWRAQLLARDAQYDAARASYEALEASMKRRRDELEGQLAGDQRLFPAAALAWSAPEDARQARQLEAELVWQEETLAEAESAASALVRLAQAGGAGGAGGALPTVRDGEALAARLEARLAGVEAQIAGLAGADSADAAELSASAARLRGRLAKFRAALGRHDAVFQARLARVVEAELPEVARLQAALAAETAIVAALAADLRGIARVNLDAFAAEALFGQVDLAWWRKEEISARMRAVSAARDAALRALDEAGAGEGAGDAAGEPASDAANPASDAATEDPKPDRQTSPAPGG